MRRNEDKTKERSSEELQKSLLGNTDMDTFEVRLQQAEQAPLESKEGYQFLVDHLKEIILVLNKKGKIIFANKNTWKDFGYSKEELIGKSITHFLTAGSITKALFALAQEFLGRPQLELEVQAKTKSGDIRYLRVADGSAPIHENGKLIGMMISANDITERKRAEEELRKSEERFKLIFEHAPDAYYLNDLKGNFIAGNKAAEKITGYEKEELIGESFLKLDLLSLDQLPKAATLLAKNAMGKPTGPDEFILKRKSGDKVAAEISTHPIKIENRTVVLGIARDITERKRAEEALRESEERYKSLFFEALDGICLADAETGMIIDCNNTLAAMVGRDRAELIGQHQAVLHPSIGDKAALSPTFRQHVAEKAGQVLETQIVNKTGKIREVEIKANLMNLRGRKMLQGIFHDITERKRAEGMLVKSEKRFRHLSELLPQIVFETDIKGNLTFANQYGIKLFGYSHGDIQSGINIFALIAPENRESIRERFKEILSGSETTAREYRAMGKDGGTFPILLHAATILEDGVPIGTRGIGIDITERKQAEEALRESEEKYRNLIERANDGIVIVQDGIVKYINARLAEMRGVTVEEVIGTPFTDHIYPDELPGVVDRYKQRMAGKDVSPIYETALRRRDGSKIHTELNAGMVTYQGKPADLVIIRDITERKRAEEALRESEEKYRILVENATEVILIAQDGRLKFTNHAAVGLTGYSDQELRSSPFIDFIHPDDRPMVGERYLRRIKGDVSQPRYSFRLINKDGSTKWVEIDAVFVAWKGKPATLNFLSDVTERKKNEEKLRQTLDGLGKALSGIFQVLSALTEKRDPYTAGHQRRVADLARAIGQEMGLVAERVEGLRLAGTIHDMGKIAIPSEILSKPTHLTEIEFNLIKVHPQVGYDILENIDFFWPIATMILQHHERMNGSGYPQGLKGENILLEARILAVADVVEAMASHRPYRPALGIEAALEEIEKSKGVLFDPDVVSACLTLFREKGFNFK